jgi:muconate cycloisomerase
VKIKRITTAIVDVPIKRPHKMSFGTLEKMNYVLVRLETEAGAEGLGEAAALGGPTWSEESAESIKANIDRYLAPLLIGEQAQQIEKIREKMEIAVRGNYFAKTALEMALFDVVGKSLGIPAYDLLGGLVRDKVPLSWSLAIGDAEKEIAEAREMMERGSFIFKIKVGAADPDVDVNRVKMLREALGEDVCLRVDANQGWDRVTAIRAARRLEPYGVDFIEQPVPRWDIDGMAAVARAIHTPVMADESLCTPHDAIALIKKDAASIFGLKLTKAGGLLSCKRLAGFAEGAGLYCYVGCMIETGIGTAAYLQLAVSTPGVTYGCELFGPLMLIDDITQEGISYRDGHILASDKPGLGVTLDEDKVEFYTRPGTLTRND